MTSSSRSSLASRIVRERTRQEWETVARSLTEAAAEELLHDWPTWARDNQLAPPGDWQTWLVLAGRGFGKTRIGSEVVRSWACGRTPLAAGSYRRIALVAETAADARDVMVEGESGLLSVHPKDHRPLYEPSKRRVTWPNGAIATLYNAVEPDQLRGPQHDGAWCDEAGKWRYGQDTWDNLQFGLRLGDDPRQVVTTTPKAGSVIRHIKELPGTVITRGSTYDNRANLAPSFLSRIVSRYQGSRLGRQELMGEELEDVPGALWTLDTLEACRTREAPDLVRIVVGVDPSGRDEDTDGDEQGIVVAGVDRAGIGYVLADLSCAEAPGGWGKRVIAAYRAWKADRIVAEVNYGGGMVRHTIHTVDPNAPVRVVHASRGKVARAEPISALYEQGRVKHVGAFAALEDQMRHMRTDGYVGGNSPDRVDALVWTLSDLMLGLQDSGGLGAPVRIEAGAGTNPRAAVAVLA